MSQHLLLLFAHSIPLVFAAVFPILNPIGSAIVLLPFTSSADEATRRLIALKVARNTWVILAIVLFVGSPLLAFFGISIPVVQAAGGLVVASMGWTLLKADDGLADDREAASARSPASLLSQTFYPFTFPVTVGPGSVAVTLTLAAHTTHPSVTNTIVSQLGAVVGFLALSITVYLCFAYTVPMLRRIGPSGTKVITRLMAFILMCIGAQIAWSGVSGLILSLPRAL